MIRIDDTLLEEIGLISLPKADRDQMLRQIYETLEMRVGMRLAERMTDQQLDEFERFIDTNDEAGALKWLETNFPDYKQVVADELEKLKGEIKKDAPKIMETMQQGGMAAGQLAQPAPAPQPQPANYSSPTSPPPYNPPAPASQQFQASQPMQQPFGAQPLPSDPIPQGGVSSSPQPLTPVRQDDQPSSLASDDPQQPQPPTPPAPQPGGGIVPPPPGA